MIRKRGKQLQELHDVNLISLVGEYYAFKGWKFVVERIQSHPEEVSQKTHSGWFPLQYAFYYHPDYLRDPIPADVVMKFLDVYPQCGRYAILEACRNPMTLPSSLESLLDVVGKMYFDVYAERDFHHLQKNRRLDLQVCYLMIAVQKNVKWKGALQYMWREEVYLYNSSFVVVLKIAVRTRMNWHQGLAYMFQDVLFHLKHNDISNVLLEAVRSEWRCIEGCNYMLKNMVYFTGNDCAKISLLQLCMNQEVAPDMEYFRCL
jgi:hypothetical protein